MSNPHPDRPIAVPKRRIIRTASNNSVGSTGSQGNTSPLANFSFNQPSTPLTAARPPVQPSSGFNTGFGSPSISGFGSTDNTNSPSSGFNTTFGSAMNTPPTTSTAPAQSTPTFGLFGSATSSNSSPSGFGSANTASPNLFSNPNAFGKVPPSSSTTSPAFLQSRLGSSNSSFTSSSFSGFHNSNPEPLEHARITELNDDSDMDSEDHNEKSAAAPVVLSSGFGAVPKETNNAFSFNTATSSTAGNDEPNKSSPFAGFTFGIPTTAKSTESESAEKSSAPTFGRFGAAAATTSKPVATSEGDKSASDRPTSTAFSFGSSAPASTSATTSTISFGTTATSSEEIQQKDTSAKTIGAPSPFGMFGNKPVTTSAPISTTSTTASPFAGFGAPAAKTTTDKPDESKKTSETPSPFGSFGISATSSSTATPGAPAFIFGKAPATAEKSGETNKVTEKPLFGSTSTIKASEDKSHESSNKATYTPSPFASLTKSSTEKSSTTSLPATAAPFMPSASTTANKELTTPSFGLFGKPAASVDTSDKDDEDSAPGKRASITSIGSNKSTTSATSATSPFSFSKPSVAESDKPTTSSFNLFGNKSTSGSESSTAPAAFSFSKPSSESDEATSTTASTGGFTFNKPSDTIASKPFTFGTSSTSASSTDKPAPAPVAAPFSFGKPADKSSPFSINKPASGDSSATRARSFSFNSNTSSSDATAPPSNKKRQLDRDDDQDGPSASKKQFSFGASAAKATVTPAFSFGASANTGDKDSTTAASKPPVSFNFGAAASGNKDSGDKAPIFTFGASASRTPSKETPSAAPKPVSFKFGTATAASTEKDDATSASKPFTFGAPSKSTTSEKPATEKMNFNFGAPPPLDKAPEIASAETSSSKASTTSRKPALSFGSTSKSATELEDGEIDTSGDKSTGGLSLGNKSAPVNKSPLSKSSTPLTKNLFSAPPPAAKDTTTAAKDKEAGKKVTFSMSVSEAPASVSLAFSKIGSTDTSATLSLSTPKKDTTSSETSFVPTTLQSNVTEPSQITYKTRFWELPDEARNELAALAHFITEQTDKKNKIDEEINSSFGPSLNEVQLRAAALDTDAGILGKQLEVQSESLSELIDRNKEQRLNANAASYVQNQDKKNWRVRGASENWNFYVNTIESMENRLRQFSLATNSIEEAIVGLQRSAATHSPENIGAIMDNQRRMYLSLAGRVAELHHDIERVAKRRKLN